MSGGKKYVTKDDSEAFARKIVRRLRGVRLGGGGTTPGGGGVSAFTELSDVPSAYTGEGLKGVRVNAAENALEFFDLELGALSDVNIPSGEPDIGDVLTYETGGWTSMPGGGGGAVPTGTGFRHVMAGVEDAAAKLVENDDVHAAAAIEESKLDLDYPTHSNAQDHAQVHDLLSADHGDTLPDAVEAGDVLIGNATPKWARLPAGAVGQMLEMGAALPGWGRKITISASDPSGGSDGDIWLKY